MLTRVFGYWPSFHDAEVINLHLWRGDVNPELGKYQFPILTLDIHHWELTKEVDDRGFLVTRYQRRSKLEFRDVHGFSMSGFNQQNSMLGLYIERLERSEGPSPFFKVEIAPAFGMSASFTCREAEVAESLPCDEEGNPLA
jgi:hypothetical protein